MKNFNKHEFDEIFRQGLIAPDLNEVDEDWALMKTRHQSQKRRYIVPSYMVFVSAIAAILLTVFAVKFGSDVSLDELKDITAKTQAIAFPTPKVEDKGGKTADSSPIDPLVLAAGTTPQNPTTTYCSRSVPKAEVSYKRNITNDIKFAFNPYLKLPLTDLGYGNIRLRSAGMSVGVVTNL